MASNLLVPRRGRNASERDDIEAALNRAVRNRDRLVRFAAAWFAAEDQRAAFGALHPGPNRQRQRR